MRTISKLSFVVISGLLGGCMVDDSNTYQTYPVYNYERVNYYPDSSSGGSVYGNMQELPGEKANINVPDSYHVGAYHSPQRAKDRDVSWINNQNPQGYTIQLADDEKASYVANKINQAPKNEHTAEIKYQQGGKNYYKGLYGSYNSQQEAKSALESLPNEVKQGAGIQQWNAVQSQVGN